MREDKEMTVYEKYGDQIPNWIRLGYTLEEMGDMAGCTKERMRQIRNRYFAHISARPTETHVAKQVGISIFLLQGLRRKGIVSPARHGKHGRIFRYNPGDIEKVKKALNKTCRLCDAPAGRRKYCEVHAVAIRRNRYLVYTPEQKLEHSKRTRAWMENHPKEAAIMQKRANDKYQEKKKREKAIV